MSGYSPRWWWGPRRRRMEKHASEMFGRLIPWWKQADDWLRANPDRLAALEAWESEFVIGSGEFGTHEWPGWADSPMGPCPW